MTLYTPPPSGDFDPYLKYNAKAGRFYFKGSDGEVEVPSPVFLADFENIRKAWMKFSEGQAPSVSYFPDVNTTPDQFPAPTEDHKLGLELRVFSQNLFNGVAVFQSNSINTCTGLSKIYEVYEEQKAANPNMVPVVAFVQAKPIKGSYGTNYEPEFRIDKWVERPEEFTVSESGSAEAVSEAQVATPPPAQAVGGGSEF